MKLPLLVYVFENPQINFMITVKDSWAAKCPTQVRTHETSRSTNECRCKGKRSNDGSGRISEKTTTPWFYHYYISEIHIGVK